MFPNVRGIGCAFMLVCGILLYLVLASQGVLPWIGTVAPE